MQRRARDGGGVLELGHRGDIELANAGAVERANKEDGAVGLVGVGDLAGEMLDEPARGAAGGVRAHAEDRDIGLVGLQVGACGGVAVHISGCSQMGKM